MNWIKTHQPTIAGIFALLGALCLAANALLDGNPQTHIDWTTIIAAMTALGLVRARQTNVTSEEAGATEAQAKREITQALKANDQHHSQTLPSLVFLLIFALGPILTLPGCTTPNNAAITAKGDVQVATGLQSIATLGQQGEMHAAFNGAAPTQLNQDELGTYMQTQGGGGWITFNPQTGSVMLWSPKDTIIEGLKITPDPEKGQTSFAASKITANITDVAKVYADQFVQVAAEIAGMSKAEAQARVDAMVAAGTITSEVADAVMTAMYPTTAATAAVASPNAIDTANTDARAETNTKSDTTDTTTNPTTSPEDSADMAVSAE